MIRKITTAGRPWLSYQYVCSACGRETKESYDYRPPHDWTTPIVGRMLEHRCPACPYVKAHATTAATCHPPPLPRRQPGGSRMSKTHILEVTSPVGANCTYIQLEEIGEGAHDDGTMVGTWHRLHGTLTVGGYDLHVTAVAVDAAGDAIAEDDQIDIDDLNSQTGDGELPTITIDGREYVLWMVPYRD